MSNSQTYSKKLIDGESLDQKRRELGSMLVAARESAGVSIDAVAYETKIAKQFIISLETGVFDELPGKVFGRGFIKNIARFLRCDAEVLLAKYDSCWKSKSLESSGTPSDLVHASIDGQQANTLPRSSVDASTLSPSDQISSSGTVAHRTHFAVRKAPLMPLPDWFLRGLVNQNVWLTILATIATIMVVAVFSRWISSQTNSAKTQAVPALAVAPRLPAGSLNQEKTAELETNMDAADAVGQDAIPVPMKLTEQDSKTSVSAGQDSAASAGVTALESADGDAMAVEGSAGAFEQVLELQILESVDMWMIIDGERTDRASYAAGDKAFRFKKKAEFMIYDAASVQMKFNGKPLGSLGTKGRKRKIVFQAKAAESDFPH
jgi:cytoskeletal protein RodZ